MKNRAPQSSIGAHLLIFHTEGPPHDHARDLTAGAQKLAEEAEKTFSSVSIFTPRTLLANDSSWEESLRDYTEEILAHPLYSESLDWNRAWAKLGLLQWKPRLIAQALESPEIADGDIVFYHDSDTARYPEYLDEVAKWAPWLAKAMKRVDVLTFNDNNVPLSSDTKIELIEKVFGGPVGDELHHLWAGAIALRKNVSGREFAKKWLELSSIENLMPVTRDAERIHFHQHSVDQATLGCLWHLLERQKSPIKRRVIYLHKSRRIPPPSAVQVAFKRFKRAIRRLRRSVRRSIR